MRAKKIIGKILGIIGLLCVGRAVALIGQKFFACKDLKGEETGWEKADEKDQAIFEDSWDDWEDEEEDETPEEGK